MKAIIAGYVDKGVSADLVEATKRREVAERIKEDRARRQARAAASASGDISRPRRVGR